METVTLIIMVAIVLDSSREDLKEKIIIKHKDTTYVQGRAVLNVITVAVLVLFFLFFFSQAINILEPLGEHVPRMARGYIENAAAETGSANLVTGVIFDFRGYDTLGEATILFTAVVGILTILRMKGKKKEKAA